MQGLPGFEHIRAVVERLRYDNDKAGLAACQQMEKLLAEYGVETKRLMPRNKDWNDDLKEQVSQQ